MDDRELIDRAYQFGDERIERERAFSEEQIQKERQFSESQVSQMRWFSVFMYFVGLETGLGVLWFR